MEPRLFIRIVSVVVAALSLSSAAAYAQSLPPLGVDLPNLSLEPLPAGYPPTTAPSAAGPYFALPAWDQTLAPNLRFIILTNFNNDAVLDRETGLVWARRQLVGFNSQFSSNTRMNWSEAITGCENLVVGRRAGWRLPTVAELKSLLDFSAAPVPDTPMLPNGHPFALTPVLINNTVTFHYWTSALVSLTDNTPSFSDNFGRSVNLETGSATTRFLDDGFGALCVRGPQ
jgi:hypothetical protein